MYFETMWLYTSTPKFQHIYVYNVNMDSWDSIVSNGLWSVTVTIYFDDQIIPDLVSGCLVKLASVSFWNAL